MASRPRLLPVSPCQGTTSASLLPAKGRQEEKDGDASRGQRKRRLMRGSAPFVLLLWFLPCSQREKSDNKKLQRVKTRTKTPTAVDPSLGRSRYRSFSMSSPLALSSSRPSAVPAFSFSKDSAFSSSSSFFCSPFPAALRSASAWPSSSVILPAAARPVSPPASCSSAGETGPSGFFGRRFLSSSSPALSVASPSSAPSLPHDAKLPEIVEALRPAVVRIYRVRRARSPTVCGDTSRQADERALVETKKETPQTSRGTVTVHYAGSGFVLKPEGVVVTAAHLFDEESSPEDSDEVRFQFPGNASASALPPSLQPALLSPATPSGKSSSPTPFSCSSSSFPSCGFSLSSCSPLLRLLPRAAFEDGAEESSKGSSSSRSRSLELSRCLSNLSSPSKSRDDATDEEVVYVVKTDDGRLFWSDLRGRDSRSDVAVLRLRAPDGAPLRLPGVSLQSPIQDPRRLEKKESPYRPRLGEFVVAVGTTYCGDEPVGACGVASQPCQSFSSLDVDAQVGYVQLGLITLPGMSGSLVANMRGEVVGMVVKKFQDYGLALPIHFVAAVAEQLDATGRYQAPSLGKSAPAGLPAEGGLVFQRPTALAQVAAFAMSRDDAVAASPTDQDLRVDSVVPGSPAEKAGVRKGDLVVAADGCPVRRLHALFDFILSRAPGDAVVVDVLREGKKQTCKVILAPASGPARPPTQEP
ncbi:putative protease Do [Toxoplasma gondii GAB2-2007-GAL-DOM2]|uniref:Protease Do n=4 Tax=Toxoplasma gondii TaxID=5811 RepID=V4YN39_TOXGV|nr:putative protease Do [Toxoplasma gondii VEG]KFG30989.1 putative protease Do [Toxoplasma gondii GAB2-2007-GAL-DOM2]KFG43435.1 putative protease Do [Toxoplasma gondii p89]PUA84663.1 putative protease Do [Toxoplasma gondii TgCATBr9]